MNKKTIIIVLLLGIVYCAVYAAQYLYERMRPQITEDIPSAAALFPHCLSDYTPLAIIDQEQSLCKGKKGIILQQNSKETILISDTQLAKFDTLNIRNNWIVTSQGKTASLALISSNNTLQSITQFDLLTNESIVDIYLSENEEKATLFVSTELVAKSPEDIKSQIYLLEIEKIPAVKFTNKRVISSVKMERVYLANTLNEESNNFMLTEATYPFLEPYFQAYSITKDKISPLTTCTVISPILNLDNASWEEKCPMESSIQLMASVKGKKSKDQTRRESNVLLQWNNSLIRISETHQMIWEKADNRNIILSDLNLETLLRKPMLNVSTRIGKRVYNCIDFGESPQISLRVCIPVYE